MDIIGRKIKEVRTMSPTEMNEQGWDSSFRHQGIVIVLDDGSMLFPSQDEEGNGPGAMFGKDRGGEAFTLVPEMMDA